MARELQGRKIAILATDGVERVETAPLLRHVKQVGAVR